MYTLTGEAFKLYCIGQILNGCTYDPLNSQHEQFQFLIWRRQPCNERYASRIYLIRYLAP